MGLGPPTFKSYLVLKAGTQDASDAALPDPRHTPASTPLPQPSPTLADDGPAVSFDQETSIMVLMPL